MSVQFFLHAVSRFLHVCLARNRVPIILPHASIELCTPQAVQGGWAVGGATEGGGGGGGDGDGGGDDWGAKWPGAPKEEPAEEEQQEELGVQEFPEAPEEEFASFMEAAQASPFFNCNVDFLT